MATDPTGNIYVTGTTSAPDFPVKNAAQPGMGEAQLLRTTDLGATWSRVNVPSGLTGVVPDPVDPQVVFGLAGQFVYKSSDGGKTWLTVLDFGTPPWQSGSLAIDPGNHLRIAALGADGMMQRSVDGGATWSRGGACPVFYCSGTLLPDPTGSGTLLVQSFQPYLSRDWGLTLQPMQLPGPLSPAAFDPSHRGWIYAGSMTGVSGAVYLSTDFGATWTAKGSPPSIFSAMFGLAVDPNQPATLVGGTADALYRSTDGGGSWVKASGTGASQLVDTHGPLFFAGKGCGALVARVSGSGYYGIGFSKDQGATWTGPALTQVTGAVPGPGCAVYVTRAVTTDAFVARLAPDGGVAWATYLGGSDADAPVAIAVDAAGSAYIVGNTSSSDFPVTGARIGVAGVNSVFVTRLSPAGKIEYSRLIGGEAQIAAMGMSVDGRRQVWITGRSNSQQLPATPGVLATQGDPNNWSGFLFALGAEGEPSVATYLPGTYPTAMTFDSLGRPVITGTGSVPGFPSPTPYGNSAFVMRLDAGATKVLDSAYLEQPLSGTPPISIAADASGNLILLGAKDTDPSIPRPTWGCHSAANAYLQIGGDIFVVKLAAADWKQVYRLILPASCPARPGALVLDGGGTPVISLATEAGFPLARPLVGGPSCGLTSGIVAKLKADGSTLEFAMYLDGCGIPALALGHDGVLVTSTNSAPSQGSTTVLRVQPPASSISLESIANTFSGDPGGVVPGALYTLAVSGFTPPTADFGLHPVNPLPVSVGGMEVRFGGLAAEIVQSGPGRVVVLAPGASGRAGSTLVRGEERTVQVWFNGVASNSVSMPVAKARPGVLSAEFLNPLWHADPPDGYILNGDGTVNSASNPAKVGSAITLFVTGVAGSDITLYPSWAMSGYPGATAPSGTVSPLPGFLSAVIQVKVAVDATLAGGPGGRALVGVRLQPAARSYFPPDSNVVGFYVK